jgi:transposase-like protein
MLALFKPSAIDQIKVVRYSPFIADEAKKRKQSVAGSWRMDETHIKVKGQWTYLFRAIDKYGNTVDFMLSEHRNEVAHQQFIALAVYQCLTIGTFRLLQIFAAEPIKRSAASAYSLCSVVTQLAVPVKRAMTTFLEMD